MPHERVTAYLKSLKTSDRVRATAFDAVYNMDDATAEKTLRGLSLPDEAKAALWDARQGKEPPVPADYVGRAVDALPAIGGAVGGAIGGIGGTVFGTPVAGIPGAVGGAALGGAAGESARQLINRWRGADAPTTPMQAAQGIGTQAAAQGVGEIAGQGVMKGARMAAHGLMDFAIRPAPTVAEEFGDIAATALKERIPVGGVIPGARKGSNIAQAKLRESAATTRGLLSDAEKTGVSFSAQDVARGPVSQLAGDIAKQPLSESELVHVSRMFAEYAENHGRLSPNGLKDLKQAAQRIAKPIYRALNQGNAVPAGERLAAQFNKAVADGSKEALETIPGIAGSEARTQSLIGANKAIRRAEVRRLPLAAEVAAPVVGGVIGSATGDDLRSRGTRAGEGIGGAVALRALLSPRSTSRGALALSAPAIQQALRQMPRAAVYAMLNDLQKEIDGDQAQNGQ